MRSVTRNHFPSTGVSDYVGNEIEEICEFLMGNRVHLTLRIPSSEFVFNENNISNRRIISFSLMANCTQYFKNFFNVCASVLFQSILYLPTHLSLIIKIFSTSLRIYSQSSFCKEFRIYSGLILIPRRLPFKKKHLCSTRHTSACCTLYL